MFSIASPGLNSFGHSKLPAQKRHFQCQIVDHLANRSSAGMPGLGIVEEQNGVI